MLTYREDGKLWFLVSDGGFLGKLNEIAGQARYLTVRCLDDLVHLKWAEEICLSGSDIDDVVMTTFVDSGAWSSVTKLALDDSTKVTRIDIEKLHLQEFWLESGNVFPPNPSPEALRLVKEMKAKWLNLRVFLNRDEILE